MIALAIEYGANPDEPSNLGGNYTLMHEYIEETSHEP
jgi:hypothetical protein